MAVLYSYEIPSGKPLGYVIIEGGRLTEATDPILGRTVYQMLQAGQDTGQVLQALAGWSSGRVLYSRSPKPPEVPDWLKRSAAAAQRAASHFDPNQPRVPGGRHGGGQWVHGVHLLPPGEGKDARPAAMSEPRPQTVPAMAEPTVTDLARMVGDLSRQLDLAQENMRAQERKDLHNVVTQMRAEQDRLIRLAQRSDQIAAATDEHRHEVVRSVVTVLGLVAAGVLLLATAPALGPALVAAAISVGPLIGAEAIALIHAEAKHRRTMSGTGGRVGSRI